MNANVAVAQIDCVVGDVRANVDRHLQFIDKAIRGKAVLVVFPELSLTGYTVRDLAWDIALDPLSSPLLERLKERSKKISIVFGAVESGRDHSIYNSALFLEDGQIKHIHRKLYLPTYGMFEEGRYFSRGKSIQAFDSKHGRFGVAICEDVWHMSVPYVLAVDGAEAILCLTASPTRTSGDDETQPGGTINQEHHRTYARLLSTYFLFSNRVGFEDGVNFWGGSHITDPMGEAVATAKRFDEDLILAPISSTMVRRARRFSRHALDEDPGITISALQRIMKSTDR